MAQPHPRFAFHFTPTSCSWLNAVVRGFAKLAKQRLKRRCLPMCGRFQATINRFVAVTNHDPANPSPGLQIQTKSSPLSGVGTMLDSIH